MSKDERIYNMQNAFCRIQSVARVASRATFHGIESSMELGEATERYKDLTIHNLFAIILMLAKEGEEAADA